eukprot:GFUD01011669.1.p2 GENE.GFUD01011669.1~~GFUD01011669.1.p2  ORF type:complete len:109 (+),score=37.85 GFUD01011669.1:76-402(+)
MCKTCRGANDDHTSTQEKKERKRYNPQARMSFPDDRKKGWKGEHKGLPWKEAIEQTALLENQERDMMLNGWPWNVAIRMEQRLQEQKKTRMDKEEQGEIKTEEKRPGK